MSALLLVFKIITAPAEMVLCKERARWNRGALQAASGPQPGTISPVQPVTEEPIAQEPQAVRVWTAEVPSFPIHCVMELSG